MTDEMLGKHACMCIAGKHNAATYAAARDAFMCWTVTLPCDAMVHNMIEYTGHDSRCQVSGHLHITTSLFAHRYECLLAVCQYTFIHMLCLAM